MIEILSIIFVENIVLKLILTCYTKGYKGSMWPGSNNTSWSSLWLQSAYHNILYIKELPTNFSTEEKENCLSFVYNFFPPQSNWKWFGLVIHTISNITAGCFCSKMV